MLNVGFPHIGGFVKMALALLVTLSLGAAENEKHLTQKELPPPVLASFQKAYPSAKLKACSQEQKDGKICYELESQDGAAERDLVLAADGAILETEEKIDPATLPEPVKQAIARQHPKAMVKKAEKVTKGSEVSYEILLKDGKKKTEVVFDAAGTSK